MPLVLLLVGKFHRNHRPKTQPSVAKESRKEPTKDLPPSAKEEIAEKEAPSEKKEIAKVEPDLVPIMSPKLTVRPPTSKKTRRVVEEEPEPSQERPKTAGRPKTARAAPPRIKVEVEEAPSADALASQLSLNDGQSSAHSQGSGRVRPVAVITEGGVENDEEEEETAVLIQTDDGMRSGRTSAMGGEIEASQEPQHYGNFLTGQEGQKGSLVQKLIETKKDFEGQDVQLERNIDRDVSSLDLNQH